MSWRADRRRRERQQRQRPEATSTAAGDHDAPLPGPADPDRLTEDDAGLRLAEAVARALPDWVLRSVRDVAARSSVPVTETLLGAAHQAGLTARSEVGDSLRRLLALPFADQRGTPLAIVRSAVRYPTRVLQEAGVPGRSRDDFARRAFPDDDYDLTPGSLGVLGSEVAELGLTWGATKALDHARRSGSN